MTPTRQVQALGAVLGVVASAVPFLPVIFLHRIGLIDGLAFGLLSPWIAYGLPIGAVAGFVVGIVLAPRVWSSPQPALWLTGAVASVAWAIGLGLAALVGFLLSDADLKMRAMFAGVLVIAGMPMIVVSFVAALVWITFMWLAGLVGRSRGESS